MRKINRIVVDRRTGTFSYCSRIMGGGSDSIGERIRQIKKTLPVPSPDADKWAAVRCDGCGETIEVDWDKPELPPGWRTTGQGDFCPLCC